MAKNRSLVLIVHRCGNPARSFQFQHTRPTLGLRVRRSFFKTPDFDM